MDAGGSEDLLDASLALAHTQLQGQLADESSLDARTMGTLGFTGALLAVDVAAKDLLGPDWWAPLVAIGIATACCLSPALGVGFGLAHDADLGPDPRAFYSSYGRRPSRDAREQLLADLVSAFDRNTRRLRVKQRSLRAAILVLALGLVTSTFVLSINRPVSMRAAHEHRHTAA